MTLTPTTRIARCCHCSGMMRVSARAMSVFCPHCQRRVTLESLRITHSHPGKTLATCGDIFVEATARLFLDIKAANVVIHGHVRGGVHAGESVEVGPTGRVVGEINTPKIVVHDGGALEGRCTVNRPMSPPLAPTDADASGKPAGERAATVPPPTPSIAAARPGALPQAPRPQPLRPPGFSERR